MNTETAKNIVTLETISKSIDGIALQLKSLATKKEVSDLRSEMHELIKPLATKTEVVELIKPLATRVEVVELIRPLATQELVDDLAIAVKNGFDRVDKRFEEVDERFNGVDERFENLEKKVDRIDSRLTNGLDYVMLHYARREEFGHLETRIKKVERRVFA